MDTQIPEKWAISSDGEHYGPCDFDSREEAIGEGKAYYDGETFYIGRVVPPQQPEEFWNADDWLEHVSCQEDYDGDWAEGWDNAQPEQKQELEDEVRAVMAAWLDRHHLRPAFFIIQDPERFSSDDCQCVDCGGDQPGHSPNCTYMQEIAGVEGPQQP